MLNHFLLLQTCYIKSLWAFVCNVPFYVMFCLPLCASDKNPAPLRKVSLCDHHCEAFQDSLRTFKCSFFLFLRVPAVLSHWYSWRLCSQESGYMYGHSRVSLSWIHFLLILLNSFPLFSLPELWVPLWLDFHFSDHHSPWDLMC